MEAADLFVARRCSAEVLTEEVTAEARSLFIGGKLRSSVIGRNK
jgi:hypothetical protein